MLFSTLIKISSTISSLLPPPVAKVLLPPPLPFYSIDTSFIIFPQSILEESSFDDFAK